MKSIEAAHYGPRESAIRSRTRRSQKLHQTFGSSLRAQRSNPEHARTRLAPDCNNYAWLARPIVIWSFQTENTSEFDGHGQRVCSQSISYRAGREVMCRFLIMLQIYSFPAMAAR